MKRFLALFLLFFLMNQFIYGQLSTEYLKERSISEAEHYGQFLGLNNYEVNSLAQIFYDFDLKLSNSIANSDEYFELIKVVKKDKVQAIRKKFGSRAAKNYEMLSEMREDSAKEYLADMNEVFASDSMMLGEITEYVNESIFPVISNFRLEFGNKLSKPHRKKIDSLTNQVFMKIDSLSTQLSIDSIIIKGIISGDLAEIDKLASYYDEDFMMISAKMQPFDTRWKKDIKEIQLRWYSEYQLNASWNVGSELSAMGMGYNLNRLQFIMIDVNRKDYFMSHLLLMAKIRELVYQNK